MYILNILFDDVKTVMPNLKTNQIVLLKVLNTVANQEDVSKIDLKNNNNDLLRFYVFFRRF